MKPKHYSLITVMLAIAVVGLVSWYEVYHLGTVHTKSGRAAIQPLSEIKVPDPSALEQMDRIERTMHTLSTPPPQIMRNVDLSALGYVPVASAGPNGQGDGAYRASVADHHVTMAFQGQVNRYCIIDSKLYPEGAVLPDGATIVKIESRRVLIAKESLQQWLDVDPLLDTTLSEKSS